MKTETSYVKNNNLLTNLSILKMAYQLDQQQS